MELISHPECGVIRKYRCNKQNKKDTENFMNGKDMVPKKLKLTSALRLMSGRMHAHGTDLPLSSVPSWPQNEKLSTL